MMALGQTSDISCCATDFRRNDVQPATCEKSGLAKCWHSFRGQDSPIRPTAGVSATAVTARSEKILISRQIQAILPSFDRPVGECRLITLVDRDVPPRRRRPNQNTRGLRLRMEESLRAEYALH